MSTTFSIEQFLLCQKDNRQLHIIHVDNDNLLEPYSPLLKNFLFIEHIRSDDMILLIYLHLEYTQTNRITIRTQ